MSHLPHQPAAAEIERERPTLLVIDGNSLAHRSWHAYPGLSTSAGAPSGVYYGFCALLVGICDILRPDGLVIGFDDAGHNERKVIDPEYKATRSSKDPDLVEQLAKLPGLLAELGIAVRTPSGWEADDVLGSAARAAEAAGWSCVLATSDRDSFQLLSEHTSVFRLRNGLDSAERLTAAGLHESYGVRPDQYLGYAAMRGDTSDNLPGIKGIGEKGASRILAEFASVEEAINDALAGGARLAAAAGKAAVAKLAHPDAARAVAHNKQMMAIRTDLELELGAELERARLADQHLTVEAVCGRWELPSLRTRLSDTLRSAAARLENEFAPERESALGEPPEWAWEGQEAGGSDPGAQPEAAPVGRTLSAVSVGADDLFSAPAPWL